MGDKSWTDAGPSNRSSNEDAEQLELVDKFLEEADLETGSLQKPAHDTVATSAESSDDAASMIAQDVDTYTKARAVILFLAINCTYDGLLDHLKVRNPTSLLLFLPGQALVLLCAVCLIRFLAEEERLQTLSAQLGDGFTILPSSAWLRIAVLAISTFISSVSYVYQAFWTEGCIGQSILTYSAPLLLIVAQAIGTSFPASMNMSAAGCVILAPAVLTCSLLDVPTLRSGAVTVTILVCSDAYRWAWAKKSMQDGMTEFGAIAAYSPMVGLLFSTTILPIASFGGALNYLDRNSAGYFALYALLASARDWSALHALRVLDSLPAFSLLIIAKCCCIVLISWSSSSFGVTAMALIALFALIARLEEVGKLTTSFRNKYMPVDDGTKSETVTISTISQSHKPALYASFIPLLAWLVHSSSSSRSPSSWVFPQRASLDVVISYYNEPMEGFHILKNEIWSRLRHRNVDINWILYLKDNETDAEILKEETGVHQVIRLPNTGREGGTYLKHILLNYNATIDPSSRTDVHRGLADKTLFVQPHLAYEEVARPRLDSYRDNTGFLSLGPYVVLDCGYDILGNVTFDRYPQLYALFRETLCPPTQQLASWSAQFFVSRKRILANPYSKYRGLDDIFDAPPGHWIYNEGTEWKYHGVSGPTNPFLGQLFRWGTLAFAYASLEPTGHVLERFWTVMFGCEDPALALACQGTTTVPGDLDKCQCYD